MASASATPALAATKPATVVAAATGAEFFGMHVNGLGVSRNLPSKRLVGAVRLWDTGTTWADIQPTPTTWNWTRLDAAVAAAKANGMKPLIVLGQTPTWASSQPTLDTGHGFVPGSMAAPAHLTQWRAYVTAVVARYSRKGVTDYQTWNEPNGGLFFTGTPQQMAALNLAAYQAVHAGTVVKKKVKVKGRTTTVTTVRRKYPTAQLVGPGFVTRRSAQVTWMSKYLRITGARQVDTVGVHLYSNPGQGPESTMVQLATVRRYLKIAKLDTLPVWVTEVSFGGAVGGSHNKPEVITPANQAAYVARFLLLARAAGVARTYWYAWDVYNVLGVELTKKGTNSVTDAGKAYQTSRSWLVNNKIVGCVRARTNTWTCTVKQRKGFGYIVWNPTKRASVKAPLATVSVTSVLGKRTRLKPNATLKVTASPQYIATSK